MTSQDDIQFLDTVANRVRLQWQKVRPNEGEFFLNHEALVRLLHVLFRTSLCTEEGRAVQFSIIFLKDRFKQDFENDYCNGHVAVFEKPIEFTVKKLVRLAPALDRNRCYIAAYATNDSTEIVSIVDIGGSFLNFQQGQDGIALLPPDGLAVEVVGPGSLRLSRLGRSLCSMVRCELEEENPPTLDMAQIEDVIRPGIVSLTALIDQEPTRYPGFNRPIAPETIHQSYKTCLAIVLRTIRDSGHGGTLLITPNISLIDSGILSIKYKTIDSNLLKLIARSIVHAADVRAAEEFGCFHNHGDNPVRYGIKIGGGNGQLQARLTETCQRIGGLAGVDGAILLDSDLVLHGFGCEIVARASVKNVYSVENGKKKRIEADLYGTRHRSVFRLCNKVDVLGFVMSQDGGIKAVRCVDKKVCVWNNIQIDRQIQR